ncbi:hypothetical protein BBH88_11580 [Planococcus antarcticus DSM 14505]|uniref:DUF5063 domain-containing protein n=1 Tax=Planococcus antarcticus DSM 14505 TaxID=1185653 RepID=A0ABN4RKH6_9BACL|nr:DUF5063 domain-containing protein [Planococcus antarcticus]ANU10905.1 hypothetical protein BBH88_11580 [Planococcus antarcticus DSM 14505]
MQSQEVEAFRVVATVYCDFIDSCRIFENEESFRKLLRIISQLYTNALDLPEVELEEEYLTDVDFPLPEVDVKHHNVYTEIFDPYHDETPVNGCLDDDIIDIYSDIKKGHILYEQGQDVKAVWEWRFGLEVHWGEHATSAIRALHSIKFL